MVSICIILFRIVGRAGCILFLLCRVVGHFAIQFMLWLGPNRIFAVLMTEAFLEPQADWVEMGGKRSIALDANIRS